MLKEMQYRQGRATHRIIHWESTFDSERRSTNSMPFHQVHGNLAAMNSGEPDKSYRVITTRLAIELLAAHGNSGELLFPIATDGLIAFETPGRTLGPEIVYSCGRSQMAYKLLTGKYAGQEAALLSFGLSQKDFHESGRNETTILIPDSRLIPVYDFPRESGRCSRDKILRGPKGEISAEDKSATVYLRRAAGCYIGSIAMDGEPGLIRADLRPWDELCVVGTVEDIFRLTGRGMSQAEIEALIREAGEDLAELSKTVRKGLFPSLRRLVAALSRNGDE